MRDNGIRVIVGQRENSPSWDRAVEDGFVPSETLFGIEEAARRGTVVQYLLSDAGQKAQWSTIGEMLNKGDMLYFSHGFGVTYRDQTGSPKDWQQEGNGSYRLTHPSNLWTDLTVPFWSMTNTVGMARAW